MSQDGDVDSIRLAVEHGGRGIAALKKRRRVRMKGAPIAIVVVIFVVIFAKAIQSWQQPSPSRNNLSVVSLVRRVAMSQKIVDLHMAVQNVFSQSGVSFHARKKVESIFSELPMLAARVLQHQNSLIQ